ncbi:MAG TPA: DinB family protein [Pyrinomonadaceae bacterium]|jgi:hypothetical protein
MIESQRWFDRQFALGLPLWMFPNIIERLRGTPARLEDRTLKLPMATLTRRDAGRWSIQEHAGHLLDLEALEMARLADYEARRPMLTPADVENRKTIDADHNSQSIDELLAAFRAERMEFVARLEACDEEFIKRSALHPRLNQMMSVIDLAFFKAEHDDHHLARISELIRLFA